MKYFIISDVHSCYDLMIKAISSSGFDIKNPNHKILFLGDAFDKGSQPLKTYLFFKSMMDNNKMIWVKGNHDIELINVINNLKYSHDCKDTPIKIAQYYDNSITENTDIAKISKVLKDNGVLDLLENKTVDYFEFKNYIATHGFIPTNKGKYDPNWRDTPSSKWNALSIRKANGVKKIIKEHINIPGKILICGHTGAYYGNFINDHPDIEIESKEFNRLINKYKKDKNNYHTYIGDKVINMDANGYKNGYINILVLEDK